MYNGILREGSNFVCEGFGVKDSFTRGVCVWQLSEGHEIENEAEGPNITSSRRCVVLFVLIFTGLVSFNTNRFRWHPFLT